MKLILLIENSMANVIRVLLLDDDVYQNQLLEKYLAEKNIHVFSAQNIYDAKSLLAQEEMDVAVFELSLGNEDGVDFLHFLSVQYEVGIIVFTRATDDIERILALEMGADDYMSKLCKPRELLARIRALQRRIKYNQKEPVETKVTKVNIGQCTLDMHTRQFFDQQGQEINLTKMEFDLLETFTRFPGKILSREDLLVLSHDKFLEPFDRSIDVRISRIRKKIEPTPEKPRFIKTIHTKGYLFSPEGG